MIFGVSYELLFAQFVGFVALGCIAVSFQMKTRRKILFVQVMAQLLFTAHFLLLGAHTGALINMLAALRGILFVRHETEKRSIVPLLLMCVLFIVAPIITWDGWKSLLPMTAMLISTLALWQLNPQRVRILMLGSPLLWLVYNVLSGSIAGVITEIVSVCSILVGVWRFRQHKATKVQRLSE